MRKQLMSLYLTIVMLLGMTMPCCVRMDEAYSCCAENKINCISLENECCCCVLPASDKTSASIQIALSDDAKPDCCSNVLSPVVVIAQLINYAAPCASKIGEVQALKLYLLYRALLR